MRTLFRTVKPLLHALDPETAHGWTIRALKSGFFPCCTPTTDPMLRVQLWDRAFPNPVGLAAGFDKNAEVIGPMLHLGFGFVEAGTVTPKAQIGNPRPRVHRNAETQAVINRMGFPNHGLGAFKRNLEKFLESKPRPAGLVGVNIGMNKDQTDAAKDYCLLLRALGPYADYIAVNVSSPNTPGLRNLQRKEQLLDLLGKILDERKKSCGTEGPPPLLVKIAPDVDDAQLQDIADAVCEAQIDGIILTNTTLARPDVLPQPFREHPGGLSGKPLMESSTALLKKFYKLTNGTLPIIGVGGISCAEDAYAKIRAGASLVQIYSALVFQGPDLVKDILTGLPALLRRDGFASVTDAVGADHKDLKQCA